MSAYFSISGILRPSPPSWLELVCQRISSNDPSLKTVELPRDLNDVHTHEIARSLDENDTVTALTLSFFSIVDDGANTIATSLGASKNIEKLQVRDIRNQREVNIFFDRISENKKLHEFSMRNSLICPKSVQSVGTFFKYHPCIQELRLVDTQFSQRSFGEFCHNLKYSGSLERLFLVNNEFQIDDFQCLKTFLSETTAPIQELHVCENDVCDEGASLIAEGVVKNSTIRLLDLRSNSISAQGAASLQGALVSNRQLTSLGLAENDLGNAGVSALARGLQHSYCGLQSLNIAGNGCDSAVAGSLATMLLRNKSLVDLNISFNLLGDCGAVAITRALTKNTSLQRLEMRKAGISCIGAEAFGKLLPSMMALKELVLTRNMINRQGGLALLDGLRHNVNLEYLLVEEKMSESIARDIACFLRLNKAGRRAFRQANTLHSALWPSIYGRFSGDSDIVYYFIRENPEIMKPPVCDSVAVEA